MAKQRISYFPLDKMDAEMQKEMDRCRREGTPRPESSAVRAHVPAAFWSFANSWRDLFRNGVCEHPIKELCRLYVSRSVQCDYCGNQRSMKAASAGMIEDDVKDLLNFEKSTRYSDKQKAALAYAEAITWHLDTDDAFWERLHRHFSEPELVELGCFIALTMGQQSWLRLLNIEHHQVLAGTSASMAPGYEDAGFPAEEQVGRRDARGDGALRARARRGRKARRCARTCRRRSGASPIPGATSSTTACCDHAIKELCRLYVSRSVHCEFCGNQRSIKAARPARIEDRRARSVNFEKSRDTTSARKRRSPMPRRSPGGSTPTTRSGSACTGTSASRSWSSSAASSRSPWASRAGCGCSTSSITR